MQTQFTTMPINSFAIVKIMRKIMRKLMRKLMRKIMRKFMRKLMRKTMRKFIRKFMRKIMRKFMRKLTFFTCSFFVKETSGFVQIRMKSDRIITFQDIRKRCHFLNF